MNTQLHDKALEAANYLIRNHFFGKTRKWGIIDRACYEYAEGFDKPEILLEIIIKIAKDYGFERTQIPHFNLD